MSWSRISYGELPKDKRDAGFVCEPPGEEPPLTGPPPGSCDGAAGSGPPRPDQTVGNPIDLVRLAKIVTVPCLSDPVSNINLSLRYDSKIWEGGRGNPEIGRGWFLSYQSFLRRDALANVIDLALTDGIVYNYVPTSAANTTYVGGRSNFTRIEVTPNVSPTEYQLVFPDGTRHGYVMPASGDKAPLTWISDRLGNRITLTRTPSTTGATTRIAHNRTGRAFLLDYVTQSDTDYGAVMRLTAMRDDPATLPSGAVPRQVTLEYCGGRLCRVTDPAGRVRTFGYDGVGRLTHWYDPANNPAPPPAGSGSTARASSVTYSSNAFYSSGIVTREVLANGTTIDLVPVTGQPWTREVIYNRGRLDERIERFCVDGGRLTCAYAPNSTTMRTSYGYDGQGLLNGAFGFDGVPTAYAVNAQGAVTRITTGHQCWRYWCDTISLERNGYGQLTKLTDPSGKVTQWQYHPTTGALQAVGDHAVINGQTVAYTTTVETNAMGQVTAVRLPDGTWNTQAYDSRGYPTVTTYDANYGGVTGRLALTEETTYDWRGYLTNFMTLQGVRGGYAYATSAGHYGAIGWPNAVARDTAPGGRGIQTDFRYDALGNLITVVEDAGTGRLNATWQARYAPVGTRGGSALVETRDPLQATTAYTYTAYGDLRQIRQIQPTATQTERRTTYAYTPQGWLDRITLHDGRVAASYGYNSLGQTTAITDTRGVRTDYTYDAKGRVATVTEGSRAVGSFPAVNATWTYGYDSNDRVLSVLKPGGGTALQRQYDGLGRLAWERDGAGNQTTYTYDDDTTRRGVLTQVTVGDNADAEQQVTQYAYDRLGRLAAQVVDPGVVNGGGRLNLTTHYAYTQPGSPDRWNLQQVTDPAGNRTTFRYNNLGLLETTTDAQGSAWQYRYDNLGALTQLTPSTGAPTVYVPDLLGRTTALSRNTQTESWAYNADGSLRSRTDFAGQVISHAYDSTGRLTGIDYAGTASDPNGARSDASFTYQPNDLLNTASSRPDGVTSAATSYTYDALNRFRSATRNSRTLTYGYDAASQLTSLQYWNRGTVSYGYDAAGRVNTLNPWSSDPATQSTYTYRSTSLLNTVQRPAASNSIQTTYGYDTASRLTGITHTNGATPVESIQYRLDQNGNRIAQRDSDGLATYQYDSLNRLTHAHLPALAGGPTLSSLNYGYDPVGNRTAVTPGRTNVALGKPASQSSTHGNLHPTNALDGDTYGHWGTNTLTLASTTESVQPWWEVDLGASQYLDTLDIWNRLDSAQERLSTFYVFVSDAPFTSPDLTATKNQAGVSAYLVNGLTSNRTNLPIARHGRYVRIQLSTTTPTMLTLAEVQVWSTAAPSRTNAALGRGSATSQSSTYSGLDAGRAVDGDTNGNWATNTGTIASTNSQVQPWWQVDLGSVQYVDMIEVWNRLDADQHRLSNFYVFVSDTPFTSGDVTATKNQYGVSAYFLGSVAPVRTSVPIGRSGRYVRVQLTTTTAEYLRLGEVQVWVTPTPSLTQQAVGKPARQSSTDALEAWNAVNGDTNGDWATNTMTMARTGSESRPWWEVDLGAVRELDRLDLWNRRDSNQALLKNALVYVSDVPFASTTVAGTQNQPGVSSYLLAGAAGNRTTIPVKRTGRYVRVQLTGTTPEVLVLAEVQVWSRGAPSGTVTRAYDASDRFSDTSTFSYDANGNLLSDGTTTYTYNAANRLMRTVKAGVTSEYFYDALGNLVRMTVGTQRTDFVLDENTAYPRVLGEVRSDGSESMYAYGPDGLHVRRDRSSGAALSTHYPLTDGLGSVRAWTDNAGMVTMRTSYDAWGVARRVTGTASRSGSPGFTGEQTLGDGTVYLRARSYNPTLGRFLQRDTFAGFAARPQSLNRYAYTEGNPVNYTDPSGHMAAAAAAAAGVCAGPQALACGIAIVAVGGTICVLTNCLQPIIEAADDLLPQHPLPPESTPPSSADTPTLPGPSLTPSPDIEWPQETLPLDPWRPLDVPGDFAPNDDMCAPPFLESDSVQDILNAKRNFNNRLKDIVRRSEEAIDDGDFDLMRQLEQQRQELIESDAYFGAQELDMPFTPDASWRGRPMPTNDADYRSWRNGMPAPPQ